MADTTQRRGWLAALGPLGACVFTACAMPGPEVVVAQAVEAARAGDREGLLACFTPASRPILSTWWDALERSGHPDLHVWGAAAVNVVEERALPKRDFGPERTVVRVQEGNIAQDLVLHRMAGVWRIDLLDTERSSRGVGR